MIDYETQRLDQRNHELLQENSRLRRQLATARHQLDERDRQVAELQRTALEAVTDELTGAYNRRWLRRRDVRGLTAVMHVDVDKFKPVNDRHGHAAGDRVLIHIASALRRHADDVVRLGGDEFLVLLFGQDPQHLAAAMIADIQRPVPVSSGQLVTSVSIGACLADGKPVDLFNLIGRSDWAMYAAKRAGGSRLVIV